MKGANIVRWMPLTIVASVVVTVVALLQLDLIVNSTLYSYGLLFSIDWAVPYWNSIRTALAMLGLTLVFGILLQASLLVFKPSRKINGTEESGSQKEKQWNTYKLSDGSTIRIKTILKGVKRLSTFSTDGKPMYAVKADNLVEVIDAPNQLMRPENQENREP